MSTSPIPIDGLRSADIRCIPKNAYQKKHPPTVPEDVEFDSIYANLSCFGRIPVLVAFALHADHADLRSEHGRETVHAC